MIFFFFPLNDSLSSIWISSVYKEKFLGSNPHKVDCELSSKREIAWHLSGYFWGKTRFSNCFCSWSKLLSLKCRLKSPRKLEMTTCLRAVLKGDFGAFQCVKNLISRKIGKQQLWQFLRGIRHNFRRKMG